MRTIYWTLLIILFIFMFRNEGNVEDMIMKIQMITMFSMIAFGTSVLFAGVQNNSLRVLRINMKDGDTKEYLVESIHNITFEANPNDSSYIIDEVQEEKESAEIDRVPEEYIPENASEDTSRNDQTTSFEKQTSISHFFMSWNIHHQHLQIESAVGATAKLAVYDLQGTRISNAFLHLSTGSNQIPLTYLKLSSGKYMVKVEMKGKTIKQEITINK